MVFPVVANVSYIDDFGAPRPGGVHQGNDIMAPRHAPAVAVVDGRVKFWTSSASAGCMLYLYGTNGTTYEYVHLNNDLTSGNDNGGRCVAGTSYAPGLVDGKRVRQGEVIGFVGDSGDANGIHPHLHFEMHPGDAGAVDPYTYLRQAPRLLFATPAGVSRLRVTLRGVVRNVLTDEGEKALVMRVRRVRLSTGWSGALTRRVVLDVPRSAVVTRETASGIVSARLTTDAIGERVRVRTPTITNTMTNQYAASSILLQRH